MDAMACFASSNASRCPQAVVCSSARISVIMDTAIIMVVSICVLLRLWLPF